MAALILFQSMHFYQVQESGSLLPRPASHPPRWVLLLRCSRSSSRGPLPAVCPPAITCRHLHCCLGLCSLQFPTILVSVRLPCWGASSPPRGTISGPASPAASSCQSFPCDPHPVPTHLSCNCSTTPIHRRGQRSPMALGPSWSREQNPQVIQFITCMSLALSGTLWAHGLYGPACLGVVEGIFLCLVPQAG